MALGGVPLDFQDKLLTHINQTTTLKFEEQKPDTLHKKKNISQKAGKNFQWTATKNWVFFSCHFLSHRFLFRFNPTIGKKTWPPNSPSLSSRSSGAQPTGILQAAQPTKAVGVPSLQVTAHSKNLKQISAKWPQTPVIIGIVFFYSPVIGLIFLKKNLLPIL